MIGGYTEYLADEAATVRAGERLGKALAAEPGGVIFLDGVLGAGKTTFCRGLLAAFGHQGAVKSPTYTLVEPYSLQGVTVYHFDLYRLGNPEELEYMGIRDYFRPDSVCVVEWPVRGQGFLPEEDLLVTVTTQNTGRCLTVEAATAKGECCLTAFAAAAK